MAHGVYVVLNVSDLDRSHAFYKGLGLPVRVESMPMGPDFTMRWVVVEAGRDHAFRLFLRDFPGADPEDVAWASGEVGKGVLLNVGVPDARKTFAAANASGAPIEYPLEENPWGGHAFMVRDPDGYVVMLTDSFPPEKGAKAAKRAATKKATKSARAKRPGAAKKGAKKAAGKAKAPAKKGAAKKAAKGGGKKTAR